MAITCKLPNQTSPLVPVFNSNRSLSIPHQVYIVGTVSQFCNGMDLTPKQSVMCEENRGLMASIRYGANLAVKQCQYQFQYRRWNCSVPERDSNTLFRRITGKGAFFRDCLQFILGVLYTAKANLLCFEHICYRDYCMFVLCTKPSVN